VIGLVGETGCDEVIAPVSVSEHASDTGTATLSFPVLTLTLRCAFCISCAAEFDGTIGILYETLPAFAMASVTTVTDARLPFSLL
jgi:hypothetical protein